MEGNPASSNSDGGVLITGASRFVQLIRSSSPVARQTVCGLGAGYNDPEAKSKLTLSCFGLSI